MYMYIYIEREKAPVYDTSERMWVAGALLRKRSPRGFRTGAPVKGISGRNEVR